MPPAVPPPAAATAPAAGGPLIPGIMALYDPATAATPAAATFANAVATAPPLLGPSVASLSVNPNISLADEADRAILAGVHGLGVDNPDETMTDMR